MGSQSWAFPQLLQSQLGFYRANIEHETHCIIPPGPLVPLSLGKPGMLTWICKTCRNPTMIYSAEVEITAGDGATVGQLRLEQHVTRDESGVAGPVMIDTVDNREKLASMKTYSFQVQIQKGSCNNLGDIVASQYCRGCTNSLGVAIIKDKDDNEVVLSELSETHSVVFFDAKNSQSKLGCGEIRNGALAENIGK